MSRKKFITDFGKSFQATLDGQGSEPESSLTIDRYGVWAWDEAKGKHQVIVTGNDLEFLQLEHGPCDVVPLTLN